MISIVFHNDKVHAKAFSLYLLQPIIKFLIMSTYYRIDESIMVTSGKRFLNYLLDIVFFTIIFTVITVIAVLLTYAGIHKPHEILSDEGPLGTVVSTFVFLLYYFIFEALTGRSIAKFITGTTVVNEYGEKLSAGQALGRTFCRLIPFEVFSFFGTPSRGWHDSIPNTYVVDAKKLKESLSLNKDFDQIGQQEL